MKLDAQNAQKTAEEERSHMTRDQVFEKMGQALEQEGLYTVLRGVFDPLHRAARAVDEAWERNR